MLYAAVVLLGQLFPTLWSARDRAMLVSSPAHWLPGVLAITVALVVAAVIRSPRLSFGAAATLALVFEIVSSYGIAAAEFLNRHRPAD